jgi:sugar lactone lactonase YvrE
VVRVDLDSGTVTRVATDPSCPNGLAIDGEGNIFVTNIFAGTVSKVTQSGTISTFAGGPLLAVGGSLGAGPNDIALDKHADALYVTNVGQSTVVKIKIDDDGGAGAITAFATGIPTPDGLVFDKKGNLYVCSPFTNSIYLVTDTGSASPFALDTSTESLNNPSNVAFQGHDLYITNLALSASSGKISVITLQFPDS